MWELGGSSRTQQSLIDTDLRSQPAAILLLQEAQPELIGALRCPPGPSSSACGSTTSWADIRDGGEGRSERNWYCQRGNETGNTLMVAGRCTMVARMTELFWKKRADGRYWDKKSRIKQQRVAVSRILVVALNLNEPWRGVTRVVVCNCHFHYLTAKRFHGFKESHNQFWDELASTIVEHEVRVLGGDFNVSVWVVARNLRAKGLQVTLAAAFAWKDERLDQPMSDSCGIFLIGPVVSTKPLWSPEVFTNEEAAKALPRFVKGQGYSLSSHMPGGSVDALAALQESFALSMEGPKTQDWVMYPAAVQKPVQEERFDPKGLLFRGGAHRPLLLFLGEKSRRKPEAIQRREERARERKAKHGQVWDRLGAQAQRTWNRAHNIRVRGAWGANWQQTQSSGDWSGWDGWWFKDNSGTWQHSGTWQQWTRAPGGA